MYVISEILLYLCFSILIGSTFIQMIPEDKKPRIEVPPLAIFGALMGIVVFSGMQILKLAIYFMSFGYEFWGNLFIILRDYKMGNAYIWIVVVSIFILFLIEVQRTSSNKKPFAYVIFLLSVGLVFLLGWSSHSAAIYEWGGFIAHSIHYLAVTTWIGVMFIAGWFAKDNQHWPAFLKWFTPLAVSCVITVIIAGLFLMNYLVSDYVNSWMVSYGQALLIKHLLIVPLLTFALINGFLMKRRLSKDQNFAPSKWFRAESVIVLFIYTVTGYMGQQSPPHNVSEILQMEKPASPFLWLFQGEFDPAMTLSLGVHWMGILLAIAACFTLLLTILIFVKRKPSGWAVLTGFFICKPVLYCSNDIIATSFCSLKTHEKNATKKPSTGFSGWLYNTHRQMLFFLTMSAWMTIQRIPFQPPL